VLGSLGYAAPEQFTGTSPVTTAADIFSWGVTVAFATTGRCPFGQGPPEALLHRVVHEAPDLTGVPADLRAAVAGALRKHPALRPGAGQLLNRLTADASDTIGYDIDDMLSVVPTLASS
jgi:serine/threonine protein kinase